VNLSVDHKSATITNSPTSTQQAEINELRNALAVIIAQQATNIKTIYLLSAVENII